MGDGGRVNNIFLEQPTGCSMSHRFEVHLKLYCTHLTVHCSIDLEPHVLYPGYSCPNVQISVMYNVT